MNRNVPNPFAGCYLSFAVVNVVSWEGFVYTNASDERVDRQVFF